MAESVQLTLLQRLQTAFHQADGATRALKWLETQQDVPAPPEGCYMSVDASYYARSYVAPDESNSYRTSTRETLTIDVNYTLYGTKDKEWRKDVVPAILALRKGWHIPAFKRTVRAYGEHVSNSFEGSRTIEPDPHGYDAIQVILNVNITTSMLPPTCTIERTTVLREVVETKVVCK